MEVEDTDSETDADAEVEHGRDDGREEYSRTDELLSRVTEERVTEVEEEEGEIDSRADNLARRDRTSSNTKSVISADMAATLSLT